MLNALTVYRNDAVIAAICLRYVVAFTQPRGVW